MNCLLDTHTLIWFLEGDSQLSLHARNVIENSKNKKFVSIASIWEMAIKINLKKLFFDGNTGTVAELIEQNGFQILPIEITHTISYESLELLHRDPFDRILIAQATVDKMVLVTKDENIQKYKIKTIW